MRKEKLIILLIAACVFLFSCGSNSGDVVNMQKDNTTINIKGVRIGLQTWEEKNLDVSTFRNGDTIPEAKTNEEWKKAVEEGKSAWCYYDNDPEKGKKYGKLYNWYAVNDPRGLAPKGWHIPNNSEWGLLISYLGGDDVAGKKMKNESGWNSYEGQNGNGSNESGLAGLPGGFHGSFFEEFSGIGNTGVWWWISGKAIDTAIHHDQDDNSGIIMTSYYGLDYNSDTLNSYYFSNSYGLSVRCVKD